MEGTTYTTSASGAPVQVVPVTVTEERSPRGGGCLSGLGGFLVFLGIVIIALEAACIGLYLYLESSAVGIYVGIFTIITGIFVAVAGAGRRRTNRANRCLLICVVIIGVIEALKTFALFAASAAMVSYAVTDYNFLTTGYSPFGFNNGVQSGFNNFGQSFNNFLGSTGSVFGYGGYDYRRMLRTSIGLKAAVMILYLIAFLIAVICAVLGCLDCFRKRSKKNSKVVMTTVYPNGKRVAVAQHKV